MPSPVFTKSREQSPDSESGLAWKVVHLTVEDLPVELSTVTRAGDLDLILFLHGFRGTKEDYVEIAMNQSFAGRPFISCDTPGSGESTCKDVSRITIPFLISVAQAVLDHFKIERYHLVGHSMGGLTGPPFGRENPRSIKDAEQFMDQFTQRTRQSLFYGNGLYAASIRQKVQTGVVRPTFESMVQISDTKPLLSTFGSLQIPKMYMYGEQYASLPYLPLLAQAGIELAMIPHSGYFVMYSNPVAMGERISEFLDRAKLARSHRE